RSVSSQTHGARGTGAGLRMALRPAVFAHVDLETPPRRLAGCSALSRHVVSVQTLKSLLASVDPAPSGARCLETVDRAFPGPAFALPAEACSKRDGRSRA